MFEGELRNGKKVDETRRYERKACYHIELLITIIVQTVYKQTVRLFFKLKNHFFVC